MAMVVVALLPVLAVPVAAGSVSPQPSAQGESSVEVSSSESAAARPCYLPTVNRQSDGTMKLGCGSHTYLCYRGDACMWRTQYETYYICQTVADGFSGEGWIVNNQTGGAVVTLYPKNNTAPYTQPAYPNSNYMGVWNFDYFKKFRTC